MVSLFVISDQIYKAKIIAWIILMIIDSRTLEEACTIPTAFTTAYYALIVTGNVRPSDSILIVNGCSDIGQASISVALANKCSVFAKVSNEQERQHLIERQDCELIAA